MIKKTISITKRLIINSQRIYDHLYRYWTGLPTMKYSQITPNLYLGGQYSLRAIKTLKKRGITAVVNMRMRSVHSSAQKKVPFTILHLPTPDLTAPSIPDLQKGITFIDSEIEKGGRVYVHCRQGEGRGPTMVIAYLISQGLILEDALQEVQRIRSFARPTKVQIKQLEKLEHVIDMEQKAV